MEDYERIELLENAQDKIREAIKLIKEATKGTRLYSGAEVYTINTLQSCSDSDDPYNIQSLIDSLSGSEDY